jgi:hypothetical protein
MTAVTDMPAPAPPTRAPRPNDHRGSWLPTPSMIAKRFMELKRRRALMIALAAVTVGLPSIFLLIRLIGHAVAPKTYGPAGGYDIFTGLVSGVLFVFGFIVAAALGCFAGASDLQEGVFRHLVVTGRSRVAIYLSRIPSGLAIIWGLVAIGYGIVCVVCCAAAPKTLNYDGAANVPAGLSRPALVSWAESHYTEVLCNFPINFVGPGGQIGPGAQVGPGGPKGSGGGGGLIVPPCDQNGNIDLSQIPAGQQVPTVPEMKATAGAVASQAYTDYSKQFLSPSNGLMVLTGLWIELEAAVGFMVGLGLASLIGQRTISVILMIVLEVILTPLLLRTHIPYMINAQRSIVGVAMDHLAPAAIPVAFGGGQSDQASIVQMTRGWAYVVVVGWLLAWTALGAWRMSRRDA